jgi:hypothetical protein
MPWARLDDRTPRHPKLLLLSRADRWTWLEVICYCAEYGTQGAIPATIAQAVPHANKSFLARAVAAGLFDSDEGSLSVHDWDRYNPKDLTGAERQARHRARTRGNGPVPDEDEITFDPKPPAPPPPRPTRKRRRGLSPEEIAEL